MMLICESPITTGPNKGLSATGTNAGRLRHRKTGDPVCDDCKEGHRLAAAAYFVANPEKVRLQRRKASQKARDINPERERTKIRRWHEQNRERARENRNRWSAANPEKDRASKRKWEAANSDYMAEKARRRRAVKASALTIWFDQEHLAARMAYWGNRCWMCGGSFEEVDHVIALHRGGPHCLSNLRPACKSCNSGKSARDWREVA